MPTRRAQRRPNLTIADVCFAIKAGSLKANIDGSHHYCVKRRDLLRFARKASLGPEFEPRPASVN